jgi:hypothetical protein
MSARSTLIKKIRYSKKTTKDLIQLLKENEYSKEEGKGFKINDFKDTEILASYIYSQPFFINNFDEKTLEFKKEKMIVKNIVSFEIDLVNQIFIILGNSTTSRRLLTEFGKITNFEIPIEDINFIPTSILQKFEKAKLSLTVSSLRIRNFKVKPDIVGTFWVKIIEPSTAKTLLTEYPGEVIYLGASSEIRNRHVNLGFYENGTLVISDPDEDHDEIFAKMKTILFLEGI